VSKSTTVSSGTINVADQLIELLELSDHASVVRVVWPLKPSIIPPSRFNAVAADLARLFASAATRHTQLRAQR
jgi:hypothetical protein